MVASDRFSLTRACVACIKTKRKCDLALPQCGRCLKKKKIDCRYTNEPLSRSKGTDGISLQYGVRKAIPRESHIDGHCSHEFGCWGCKEHSSNSSNSDSSSDDQSGVRSLSPHALALMHPTFPEMRLRVDQPTANYLLAQLKSFPPMFLDSGSTPFIHPRLYRKSLPRSMQTAYGICGMDLQWSSRTRDVSSQALDSAIGDLLASASSAVNFMDNLAFVQALILIQILTLFSPSISLEQRIKADFRQYTLDKAAKRLWDQAPGELPPGLSPYEAYIFAESIRRTIHIWNKVRCTYDMFSKGYFVHTLFAEAMPFDRRTELWTIADDEILNVQVGSMEPEIVSYREFTTLWDSGEVRQGGLFETILLIACRGKKCVEAKIKAHHYVAL